MRIAHLSDPHILSFAGVENARLLLNKRATGWVNIKLHRGSVHRRQIVEAMMDDIRNGHIDHVVITGDITNLSLEPEFELALQVIARLGFSPDQVSVIPGNHDVYTRGSERDQRFSQYFAKHITSDLAVNDAGNHRSGPFPFVRLRGDAAIIGMSSAVARMPLMASGHAGEKQITALQEALEHPEVRKRTPVVLIHHPLINPRSYVARVTHGLEEAPRIRAILDRRRESLVLHGHLHERAMRVVKTSGGGKTHHMGATSASLVHRSHDRMSSYNVYEIGPDGLESVTARVWDDATKVFVDGTVRERDASIA